MKLIKFFKKNWILILIIAIGLFLRLYRVVPRFTYSHDQDLIGWFVRDVLSGHLRLIGQETSVPGVFIGSVFYYLIVPFYLIFGMNPIGGIALVTFLSVLTIVSIYFVFSRIFDNKIGLIGAFLYSVSYYFVLNNQEVVPTMPVSLWGIWYLYSLYLIIKNKKLGYILSFGLIGFIWNINFALAIPSVAIPVAIVLSKRKINFKWVLTGLVVFFIVALPFLFFETRHGFQQSRAITLAIEGKNLNNAGLNNTFSDQFWKVADIVYKNTTRIFIRKTPLVPDTLPFFVLTFVTFFAFLKNRGYWKIGAVIGVWTLAYVLFFTFSKISLSEYYFNGLNIVWLTSTALSINFIYNLKGLKWLVFVALALFLGVSFYRLFTYAENGNGYVERKALIDFIKKDSLERRFDCVSISYITDPGYDLGYRYLIWLDKLKLKHPQKDIPVYTVAFPLSKVGRTDVNFGVLGLVLPDYKRYTEDRISKSCQGEDTNLTDPMILFTTKQ